MSLKDGVRKTTKIKRYKFWKRAVSFLGMAVVFVTTYMLILPAITLTKPACGLEEHIHTEECYSRELVCSEEKESLTPPEFTCTEALHQHESGCYDEEGRLVCGKADYFIHKHNDSCFFDGELVCPLEETEEHSHTDDCFTEEKILVCDIEETEGHTHDDSCYTTYEELVCSDESEEHSHDESCYETHTELTCGLEEQEGHTHSDDCYKTVLRLNCDKPQLHTHDEGCYDENGSLICPLPETEEHIHSADCMTSDSHIHTEDCYKEVLACGLEEHTHSDECYKKESEEQGEGEDGDDTIPLVPDVTVSSSSISPEILADNLTNPADLVDTLIGLAAEENPEESALRAEVTPHADIPMEISGDGAPSYENDLVVEKITDSDRNDRTYDELKKQAYSALGYESEEDFDNSCPGFEIIDIYYENASAYLNESSATVDLFCRIPSEEGKSKLHILSLGENGATEITPTEVVRDGDYLSEYIFETENLNSPVALADESVFEGYVSQFYIGSLVSGENPISSGTMPFDEVEGDGYDKSAEDTIVRTFDDVTYTLHVVMANRMGEGASSLDSAAMMGHPLVFTAELPYDVTDAKFDLSKFAQFDNDKCHIDYYKGEQIAVREEYDSESGGFVKRKVIDGDPENLGAKTTINELIDENTPHGDNPYSTGITKQVFTGEFSAYPEGSVIIPGSVELKPTVSVQSAIGITPNGEGKKELKPIFNVYIKGNDENYSDSNATKKVDVTKTAGIKNENTGESKNEEDIAKEVITVTSGKFYSMNIVQNVATKEMGNFNFDDVSENHGNKIIGDVKAEQEAVYGKLLGYGVSLQLKTAAGHGMKGVELPTKEASFDFNVAASEVNEPSKSALTNSDQPVYTPDGTSVSSSYALDEAKSEENHNDEIALTNIGEKASGLSVSVIEDGSTPKTQTAAEVISQCLGQGAQNAAAPLTKAVYTALSPSAEYDIMPIAIEGPDDLVHAYVYFPTTSTNNRVTVLNPESELTADKLTKNYMNATDGNIFSMSAPEGVHYQEDHDSISDKDITIPDVGKYQVDRGTRTANNYGHFIITFTVPSGDGEGTAKLYLNVNSLDSEERAVILTDNSEGEPKTQTFTSSTTEGYLVTFDGLKPGHTYTLADDTEKGLSGFTAVALVTYSSSSGSGSYVSGDNKNTWDFSGTQMPEEDDRTLEGDDNLNGIVFVKGSAGGSSYLKAGTNDTYLSLAADDGLKIPVPTNGNVTGGKLTITTANDSEENLTSDDGEFTDGVLTFETSELDGGYITVTARDVAQITKIELAYDSYEEDSYGIYDNSGTWSFTEDMPTVSTYSLSVEHSLEGSISFNGTNGSYFGSEGLHLNSGDSLAVPIPDTASDGTITVTFTSGSVTVGGEAATSGTAIDFTAPASGISTFTGIPFEAIAASITPTDNTVTISATENAVITEIRLTSNAPEEGTYGTFTNNETGRYWEWNFTEDMPSPSEGDSEKRIPLGGTIESHITYNTSASERGYYSSNKYIVLKENDTLTIDPSALGSDLTSASLTVSFNEVDGGKLSIGSDGLTNDSAQGLTVNEGTLSEVTITAGAETQITGIKLTYTRKGDATEDLQNDGKGYVYIADTEGNSQWTPHFRNIEEHYYNSSERKNLIDDIFTLSDNLSPTETSDNADIEALGKFTAENSARTGTHTLTIKVPEESATVKSAQFYIRAIGASSQSVMLKLVDVTDGLEGTAPQATSSKISSSYSNTMVFSGLVPGHSYELTAVTTSTGGQTSFGFSFLALVTSSDEDTPSMTAPQAKVYNPVLWDYSQNVSGTIYGKWHRNMNWEEVGENTNIAKQAAPFNSGTYTGGTDSQENPLAIANNVNTGTGEYEEYYGGNWNVDDSQKITTAEKVIDSSKGNYGSNTYHVTVSGYKFDFDNWHFPTNYAGSTQGNTSLSDKGMGGNVNFFSSGYFQVFVPFPENNVIDNAADNSTVNSSTSGSNADYQSRFNVTASLSNFKVGDSDVINIGDELSSDTDDSGGSPNIDGVTDNSDIRDLVVGNIQTMNAIKTRFNSEVDDEKNFDFETNNYPDGSYYIANDGLNGDSSGACWGTIGQEVDLWGSILLRPASSYSLGAANVLVLFDSAAFELDGTPQPGSIIKSLVDQAADQGAAYKMLYVFDNKNKGGYDSTDSTNPEETGKTYNRMISADQEDLYYSTSQKVSGMTCVGVLMEVRNVEIPKNTNVSVRIPVKVKADAKVGSVYYMHTSAWAWTYDEDFGEHQAANGISWESNDASLYDGVNPGSAENNVQTNDAAIVRTVTGNGQTKNVIAFNRNYGIAKPETCTKTEYDGNVITKNQGDYINGMSFLVTGYSAKVEVTDEQRKDGAAVGGMYSTYSPNSPIPYILHGIKAEVPEGSSSIGDDTNLTIDLLSGFEGAGTDNYMLLYEGNEAGDSGVQITIGDKTYYVDESGETINIKDTDGTERTIKVSIERYGLGGEQEDSPDGARKIIGKISLEGVPIGVELEDIKLSVVVNSNIINGDRAILTANIYGEGDLRPLYNSAGGSTTVYSGGFNNTNSDIVQIATTTSSSYPKFVRGTRDDTVKQEKASFEMMPNGSIEYIIRVENLGSSSAVQNLYIYDVLPKSTFAGGDVRLKLKSVQIRTVDPDTNGQPDESSTNAFRYPDAKIYLSSSPDAEAVKAEWRQYTEDNNPSSGSFSPVGDDYLIDGDGEDGTNGEGTVTSPITIGDGNLDGSATSPAEQTYEFRDDNNYTALFACIGSDTSNPAIREGRILQFIITVQPMFDEDGDGGYEEAKESLFSNTGTIIRGSNPIETSTAEAAYVSRHISGVVWLDANQDGVRAEESIGSAEERLEGVRVTLFSDNGAEAAQRYTVAKDVFGNSLEKISTDEHGVYSFDNLPKGDYIVAFDYDGGNEVSAYQNIGSENSNNDGVKIYGSDYNSAEPTAQKLDRELDSFLSGEGYEYAIKYSTDSDSIGLASKEDIYNAYNGTATVGMAGNVENLAQNVTNLDLGLDENRYSLPETGGFDYRLLQMAGGLCFALAGIVLCVRRRRHFMK